MKSVIFGNIGEVNLERRALNRAAEILPTPETINKIYAACNESIKKIKKHNVDVL